MDFLHKNASIGSLVAKVPEYANVFEKLRLDYCCKGNKTLKELCDEKNLDIAKVLQDLKQISISDPTVDWDQMSTKEIIEHIVNTYHTYSRQELSRISQLLEKLNSTHGNRYPNLNELETVFEKMKDSLLKHMAEEENIVFPLIIQITDNECVNQEEANNYLCSLNEDHLETKDALENIRKLTNDYTPPTDACITHIVMLNSLSLLEKNLHEHIHKENHILFHRLEKKIKKQC